MSLASSGPAFTGDYNQGNPANGNARASISADS